MYRTIGYMIVCLSWMVVSPVAAQEGEPVRQEQGWLARWQAGEEVSESMVAQVGVEHCFTSGPITEELFQRMQGRSYKADCTVPREELRYLQVLHRDATGAIRLGEMVCNRAIADDLLHIFRQLYEASYPIERMVLIDDYEADDERSMEANNSSAFNFRFIAGTQKLSRHSKGMAVDINPLYNPYVKKRPDGSLYVSPEAGRRYVDRSASFTYMIQADDLCCRLFKEHGFRWGGDWNSLKDYQHFEKP